MAFFFSDIEDDIGASTPTYVYAHALGEAPPNDDAIERERVYTRNAGALFNAIRNRGPSGSPLFWHWVAALQSMPEQAHALGWLSWEALYNQEEVVDLDLQFAIAAWDEVRLEPDDTQIADRLLEGMYQEGRDRASSDAIAKMIGDFLELQSQKRIDAIEQILHDANVSLLPPEFVVGLLRVNFPERAQLASWHTYLDQAEAELAARGITDIPEIVRGLRTR